MMERQKLFRFFNLLCFLACVFHHCSPWLSSIRPFENLSNSSRNFSSISESDRASSVEIAWTMYDDDMLLIGQ
jgi:hypothetical protein